MIDDFNKRQRVIDLGEEAEDEILIRVDWKDRINLRYSTVQKSNGSL